MKTKQTYSVEFKERALSKVLQRGSRTVGAVADELNVNVLTLRNWMRGTTAANRSSSSGHAGRPEDWSLEERLMALHESHGLVDDALNGWCRERGLFAHHLVQCHPIPQPVYVRQTATRVAKHGTRYHAIRRSGRSRAT
ncbi:transposase [Paraburkholderia sp. CNPSo 3076]|uniref:transposase n=1 Tax=Paraburkholderia sp. CNPSo 3076 TaxID=2940936 RepID=UPI00224F59D5|nr:transposase [Paraburkholderia sp. CNPSo 3076]MCX5545674.1 transposase [Paraburkholderia sp. CNPSo 3076]